MKFAQLLFGVDVAFENYAERLPHRSNKSFLLFAKGACAEGRPFFEIGDFIAPQLEEIQRWEQNVRNNNARPTKSQQMLNADGWTVYYWSAQVTRAPCLCRTSFGADAHQKHVPTSSAMCCGVSLRNSDQLRGQSAVQLRQSIAADLRNYGTRNWCT